MKISELLAGVKVNGEYADAEISGITDDSRKVKEGTVFVCIKGEKFDGHSVAKEMLEKGAVAVVCEHSVGSEKEIIVDNARQSYSLMCANYFGNPAKELKLVGLTGTNGKTSATYLIKSLLESVGKKVGLIGTMQNMVGDEIYPTAFTTPDAYSLQELFRKMVDARCEYCVMEVSSQALAQGRCDGLHFAIAVFTNLTQDHLDYHGTMENYRDAKKILFRNADTAIINIDDPNGKYMVEGLDIKVVTYSAENNAANFVAKNVTLNSKGITYELLSGDKLGRLKCPIPGTFTVYNSLAAASVAVEIGVPFAKVLEEFKNVSGVKGRIEVVPTDTDYTVIIDYAHSPDGLKNILTSVREFAKQRIIVVFGCGGDRDKTKRPKMAKIAAELADFVVITSDNPRTEDPEMIVKDVAKGLKGFDTAREIIVNRTEGIRFALAEAKKDDIVVLAGKGHETYQIIGTTKNHYDEREIVAGILSGEI